MNYRNLMIATSVILMAIACSQPPVQVVEAETAAPTPEEMANRGEYLVGIMGCNDCHTPKVFNPEGFQFDTTRLLSGHPSDLPSGKYDPSILTDWVLFNGHFTSAVGPWGTSFSGNLTSDATGIGNWTLEQFGKALREGKYKGLDGARTLLPPMPWENFRNLTDADLEAIFTYLKSTKPVNNVVPAPLPPAGMAPGA